VNLVTGNLLIIYLPLIIALAVILGAYLIEYNQKRNTDKISIKNKVSIAIICALTLLSIFVIVYITSFTDPAATLSENDAKYLISNEIKNMPEFSSSYGLISMTNTSFTNKTNDVHFDVSKMTFVTNDQAYASFTANYTVNKYTAGNSKLGKGNALFTWDNDKNRWKVEIIEFKAIN